MAFEVVDYQALANYCHYSCQIHCSSDYALVDVAHSMLMTAVVVNLVVDNFVDNHDHSSRTSARMAILGIHSEMFSDGVVDLCHKGWFSFIL